MVICGLKLTHDGCIALIEDGKLIFSIEMEKLNNNPRYTEIKDTAVIEKILLEYGYSIKDVDYFVIDGWGGNDQNELAIQPRLEIGETCNRLSAFNNEVPYKLDINLYEESKLDANVIEGRLFEGLQINNSICDYYSYLHVAGHIMSAYSTSDFAKKGESSYVLVWDGGMYPRLYYFDAKSKKIENLGPIFLMIGNIYTIFSQHYGPYKVKGSFAKDSLSIAGKVMAYIALGEVKEELFEYFDNIYQECYTTPMGFANVFANIFKEMTNDKGYRDEDILASFHVYLQNMLIEKLEKKIKRFNRESKNLCISGGCALNIKWNSAIREKGIFEKVYVSPFPNDSGNAIGMACCLQFEKTGNAYVDWNVYSGPEVIKNTACEGWTEKSCSIEELAKLLYETNEPVVFLNGRAELGPRALGNRSIIATAEPTYMKELLNEVKKREYYRPVSPICLEEDAPKLFIPGTPDPYMLFDHRIREEYKERVPAICHLDGTARLQTVTREQNPIIGELLVAYKKLSGIPLLCNTSANFNGKGFFPDVRSVTEWGRVNYVWCDNTLYEKKEKITIGR
ncbi:carbamoyltransferase N-terminal domain-containing protein [Cellulosilyticum ruminicola]|uniref:carbamoyltransferase N-terminal domain-containing protein n=1 Tax=Cellulosilyticum ruminicola TaxID=425254 RepID=UPI0006D1F81E|nr:carbamoyltransferase N-terminal domain-containing protein [Cellulosilyticum ruminicola]